MSRKLLFSISHGFQKRMFIDSGLIKKLSDRGYNIGIVAAIPLDRADLQGINNLYVFPLSFQPVGLASFYVGFRRLFLWRYKISGSLLNFKNNLKEHKNSLYILAMLGRQLPFEVRLLIDKIIMRNSKALSFLEKHSPDILVFASGFLYQDATLNYAAYKLGIKRIMVGQSWDNFSTKSYTVPKPDGLICWGKRMAEEAIKFNDFPPSKVFITGAPHFDIYYKIKESIDKKTAKKYLGLNPEIKTIVYGTSSQIGCPTEYRIVEQLSKFVASSPNKVFDEPVQMIIRLHPMQIVNNEESFVRLKELENERIKVEIPKLVIGINSYWDIKNTDMYRLGIILRASDVAVNCFSTFSLDALAMDLPVIITAYDYGKPPYGKSVRRYLDFIHIKGLLSKNGIKLVYSNSQLYYSVNQYLKNPCAHWKNRIKTCEYELFKIDGKAVDRIIQLIEKL